MCGLFGFTCYGNEIMNLSKLTNSLSVQSAVRGTDAVGIAFAKGNNIAINKVGKSARDYTFKHDDSVRTLIGHTRHSTQGSERRNYNNHPFFGKVKNTKFALAHNGVLMNDDMLRASLKLPKTKIETDSYIAVQLIENKEKLDFESLAYMAESIYGSFSFSVLDNKNNLYLVKGDSPLSILHFPENKVYVYASTDEILYRAIVDSPLFGELKACRFERIEITDGDILKISPNGEITKGYFEYSTYYGRQWYDIRYGSWNDPRLYGTRTSGNYLDEYTKELKFIASYEGISPETIDKLLQEGFTPEEVEEYIYAFEGEVMEATV